MSSKTTMTRAVAILSQGFAPMMRSKVQGNMRIDTTSIGMIGDAAIAVRPVALLSAIGVLLGGLLLIDP